MARRARSESLDPLIAGQPWSHLWPELARHLARVLSRRVPPGNDPEELVQETAYRILRSQKTFVDAEHAAKEATRIAVNLASDTRRRARVAAWAPMPLDMPAAEDVERQVMLIDQWTSLQRHAARRSIDLQALADPSAEPDCVTEAAKSRRYRARKLLREWRDASGVALALPKLRWLLGGATAAATFAAGPLLPFPSEVVNLPPLQSAARPEEARSISQPGLAKPGPPQAPGSPAPARTPAPAAAQPGPTGPAYRPQFEIRLAAGAGADKGTREYPPGEEPSHLACVRQEASPVSEVCVPHPLRQ